MKSAFKGIVLLGALLFLTLNLFAQKSNSDRSRGIEIQTAKTTTMKTFVLIVRFDTKKTLPPEKLKILTEKWAALIEKWTKQGNFVAAHILPQQGFIITGAERKTDKGFALTTDGFKVVSIAILSANNLEEAVELAKDGANLDEGGTIEIREIKVSQTLDRNRQNRPSKVKR